MGVESGVEVGDGEAAAAVPVAHFVPWLLLGL